ncbi:MAG: outer membrane lipoprotein-sorting protein [Bacteroidales bacterium]|jgi:hypothetical protein|nr:outer membrane lipoprotein-sorting protein [Bacteroidales bacterium]
MKRITLLVLTTFMILSGMKGQTEDASSLLDRSRDMTITDALEAKVRLTITDKNGNSRVRENKVVSKKYPDGTEKRLIRFMAPAEVQGTAILIYDYKDKQDDMWIYLPALKRVRRIVSTEKGKSFMGSEFTNSDISSPPSADFRNRHLDGSGKSGEYIIESAPVDVAKENEYGYSRRISYFEMGTLHLRKIEFFDKNGTLYKTIEVGSVVPLGKGGGYMIAEMTATNHVTGRHSSMKMENITTDIVPNDILFDSANLDR